MVIYVGLDLSLTSPGVAIYETVSAAWTLYGFEQRVREHGLTRHCGATTILLLPRIPSAASSNEARYEHIRHYIVDVMLARFHADPSVVVGIECYAFGAKNAGSSYKLQELGGIVKHSLWKTYPTWRQEIITPGQWKKQTIGSGRATKADALKHIQTHGPVVCLLPELGLELTSNGDVPCPAQDLADAACIVLSLLTKRYPSPAIGTECMPLSPRESTHRG
jgi:hypothetical protein